MTEEKEKIFVDFEPNDFILRISPVMGEDDEWTGELNVGYLTLDENYLSEEDYMHVDMVTNMALSSIPLMEEDLQVRAKLYQYTMQALRKDSKDPFVEKEENSNVIKLRFGQ